MGLPGKVDHSTIKQPGVTGDAGAPIPDARGPVQVVPPTEPPRRPDEFTWATSGLSCTNSMDRWLPLAYPQSLVTAAQNFERIRVQYCRGDTRAPRMAFHFLQDGPKILPNDSEDTIWLKADLILAAGTIAVSSLEFRVSVRQYTDPAEAALRTLELKKR